MATFGGSLSSSFTVTPADDAVPTVYPVPDATATVTEPFGSWALSPTVSTVKVAVVDPAVIVTIFEPSLPVATKSLPVASDTVRFTVRSATGAWSAVTVKLAAVPSVTAEPPSMVIDGKSSSVMVNVAPITPNPSTVAPSTMVSSPSWVVSCLVVRVNVASALAMSAGIVINGRAHGST